jgi:hypothetical protein
MYLGAKIRHLLLQFLQRDAFRPVPALCHRRFLQIVGSKVGARRGAAPTSIVDARLAVASVNMEDIPPYGARIARST